MRPRHLPAVLVFAAATSCAARSGSSAPRLPIVDAYKNGFHALSVPAEDFLAVHASTATLGSASQDAACESALIVMLQLGPILAFSAERCQFATPPYVVLIQHAGPGPLSVLVWTDPSLIQPPGDGKQTVAGNDVFQQVIANMIQAQVKARTDKILRW